MTTEKKLQKTLLFSCEKCEFTCCKHNEFKRHLETNKHKRLHDTTEINSIKEPKKFNCVCGKKYNHHTSLAKHKRICVAIHTSSSVYAPNDTPIVIEVEEQPPISDNIICANDNVTITKEMFMTLLKDNQEMMKMIKSIADQQPSVNIPTNNTTNSNNTINSNNTNNTFNMNMFLNEKCKDAMNMKDFVNSIQLNMIDMENVERDGYVEGMSNILITNLQKTDVYKRPVHCSDVKRETIYVKDDNKWERDAPNHPKMVNAVLAVEQKNVAMVGEWAKANPRCMNSSYKENEKYFKLSKAATDGEKDGNIAKVIRKVAKNVSIDKETPLIQPV